MRKSVRNTLAATGAFAVVAGATAAVLITGQSASALADGHSHHATTAVHRVPAFLAAPPATPPVVASCDYGYVVTWSDQNGQSFSPVVTPEMKADEGFAPGGGHYDVWDNGIDVTVANNTASYLPVDDVAITFYDTGKNVLTQTVVSMSVAQIAPGNMLSNVTDSNIPDGAVSCTAQVEGSS
jgi:hypothetical protein